VTGPSGSAHRILNVAVVQSGGCPPDRATAVAGLLDLFEQAATPGVDLVVFPELATTPYFGGSTDDVYKDWAQPIPGPDTDAFAAAARRLGVGVIFGLYERAADGTLYNSAVVIDADGALVLGTDFRGATVSSYRKASIPMNQIGDVAVNEKRFFEPGDGTVLFEAFGTRIACLICYDRSFPEYWLAARAAGAEVVVALVSSLGSREALFTQELQVRAMETQVWVIAPNRGGPETLAGVSTSYFGLSCVVAPDGAVVAAAAAHTNPELLHTSLDLTAVDRVRAAFPLSRDRRPQLFHSLAEQADLLPATDR
jgi:beta-ureidopropionase